MGTESGVASDNAITLKTLDSALALLRYFDSEHRTWGVRELAKASSMSPSVVQRMLVTMVQHGFLTQRGNSRRYALGMVFFEYAQIVREGLHLSELISPVMRQIATQTGETVFLTVLDGLEAVFVEIAESPQSIKHAINVGTRVPLHAGAFAKVIMAFLSEEDQGRIVLQGVKRFTEWTITDAKALSNDLAAIKAKGWNYSVGEYAEHVFGIAVPVFDSDGKIFGSLCVSGPDFRISDQKVSEILSELEDKKEQIERAIRQVY
ncbi:IclR family transcriptional regulator [Collimonas antrihumi]|uniref:IclR family transcriptional regulator n=1 Tax=Collimonas antrihumi TaxID=1940615 RepID=UPI001B8CFFD9|nr:IclR family transcriptional regulator [Collimonas antrihumi]